MLKRQFKLLLKNINAHKKDPLDLSGWDFSDNQMFKLASAIKKNPVIKQVNFSSRIISDEGAKVLADLQLKGIIVGKADASSKTKIEVPSLSNSSINIERLSLQKETLEVDVPVDKKISEEPFSESKKFSELEEVSKAFPEDFETILERLNNGTYNGEYLDLSSQELNDDHVKILVLAIKKNGQLIKRLNLSQNSIQPEGAIELSTLELDELDLSYNWIDDSTDANALSRATEALSQANIKTLDLSANALKFEGAKNFSKTAHITVLLLRACKVGNSGAQAIFDNRKLEVLDLGDNDISDDGVSNIFKASSLVELSLNGNTLTDIGVKHIATNKKIKVLSLMSNDIRGDALHEFIENDKLTKLNLACNNITRIGCLNALNIASLQEVNFFQNHIHFTKEDCLPEKDRSLVKINLAYNHLDSDCRGVLEALASIPKLKSLDLNTNNIDKKTGLLLFRYNPLTLDVNLVGNPIDDNSLDSETTIKVSW